MRLATCEGIRPLPGHERRAGIVHRHMCARDTGVMPANLEPTITRALEVLANLSGNAKTLDAPLTFRNKRVFFAGLPIGPAPNLALR